MQTFELLDTNKDGNLTVKEISLLFGDDTKGNQKLLFQIQWQVEIRSRFDFRAYAKIAYFHTLEGTKSNKLRNNFGYILPQFKLF